MGEAANLAAMNLSLMAPLAFAGDEFTSGRDALQVMGATDFLAEMQRRRLVNTAWTEKQAIDHAAAAFRNKASRWWTECLQVAFSEDKLFEIKNNWEAFEKVFRQYWKTESAIVSLK